MPSPSRPRQRRSVFRLAATAAAVAATVIAVAACGASVSGSPQPNAAAAVTTTVAPATTSEESTTARTSVTSARPSSARPTAPSDPTDLTELTDPTELSDITVPTDLTIPTDLGSIPGFSEECTSVSIAYLAIALAPLSALGGSGQFDDTELQKALSDLDASGQIPDALTADFQTLSQISAQAAGSSLEQAGDLLNSPEFTTASENVNKWIETNCGS